MKVTVNNRIVGWAMVILAFLWPFITYPFTNEEFYGDGQTFVSLAQGWRACTLWLAALGIVAFGVCAAIMMIVGTIEFSKTFTLPPYKKKVYVNQEDLAAYYYQCRRKAIVEGDDKTLIRIDKELRAMKLPLDPN